MTDPKHVISELLENTAPGKIESVAKKLVADDATYISLNFENPELKKILPWTGTSSGPQAFIDTFTGVAKYWTIEDFAISALFGEGEDVAVFGSFTYRSNSRGHVFRSPFSIHARISDGKIIYFQFMEDTFASGRSFSSGGTWTIQVDPQGPEYQV